MVVFILTIVGGLGLLGLAVWPGMLEDAVFSFPFFCLSLPLLAFWFVLLLALSLRDVVRKQDPAIKRRRWALWSTAVMLATIGLLWFHVPQRLVFACLHNELRASLNVNPTDARGGEVFDRRVGPYSIDRYGADRRGGVFFRTHIGPDGIGPDQMSYGFAFRPNGQGTPFGNARYRYRHLFGEWYVYAASDDW